MRATTVIVVRNLMRILRLSWERSYDLRFGVETAGRVNLEDLGFYSRSKSSGVYYEATPPGVVRFALRRIAEPLENLVFIDLGSGKGRTVLIAAAYPFARVVGVEFSPQLHRTALRNVRRYRGPVRAGEITMLNMDAVDFVLEARPCVVFLYNPFRGEVMRAVCDRLIAAARNAGHALYVIYYNSNQRHWIEQSGAFTSIYDGWAPPSLSAPHRRALTIWRALD